MAAHNSGVLLCCQWSSSNGEKIRISRHNLLLAHKPPTPPPPTRGMCRRCVLFEDPTVYTSKTPSFTKALIFYDKSSTTLRFTSLPLCLTCISGELAGLGGLSTACVDSERGFGSKTTVVTMDCKAARNTHTSSVHRVGFCFVPPPTRTKFPPIRLEIRLL